MLVRRALGDPVDEAFLKEAIEYFLGYYRVHKLDYTLVYDGIKEALTSIRGNNGSRTMAVLSNKPVNPSRDIINALGLGEFFAFVYGGNSFQTKKPDPLGARTLLRETMIKAEETLIVGDSSNDILTGRNAGLWSCGVTYGFAPHTLCEVPPDVVIDSPEDLLRLFQTSNRQ